MPKSWDKDPDAILDYTWDWSDWLQGGETISSHAITISPADELTKNSSANDADSVTAWLSAGEVGTVYKVTCEIVTSQSRTEHRTATFTVVER